MPPATCCCGGWAPRIAASLRRSDRAFRVGGDEFAILLPDTDADGAYVVTRRLLATCLEGEARRAGATLVLLGRDRRHARLRPRPRVALQPGRRRALLGQAPRPDVRDHLRPRAPRGRGHRAQPAELSALVARVAATGAVRAVFQPIYDLVSGRRRAGYEGLVRPLPNSGFNDPGTMFAAAEATGRTAELDIACLEAVMERGLAAAAAGFADRQPLATDAGDGRLQHPGLPADDRPARPGSRAGSSSS